VRKNALHFLFIAVTVLAWMVVLLLPTMAEESESVVMPDEYQDMLDQLPDAIKESLPKDILSSDPEMLSNAWQALSSPRSLIEFFFFRMGERWQTYLSLLMQLCGVILLRAVFNGTSFHIKGGALQAGSQLVCRVSLFALITTQAIAGVESVVIFYRDLTQLTTAFLPLMGSMYAMGGNVGAAVANHSNMILSLSLTDWLGGKTILPLFSLCLAFGLLGAFGPSIASRMNIVTGKIKKWYTTLLSLTVGLLTASLGAQTLLAARADNLRFRTLRFAISSSIPVVGGGVAEMLRNASGGIGWLRGVVGIGGVLLLFWLLLPQLLHLLMVRAVYQLSGDVGAWMGCDGEAALLYEVAGLFGYLLAVVALSCVTFLCSLLLLLKCGSALGG
jgi:stage III sporulation protein AE